MKYINKAIYSCFAFCMLFSSCDPMEDVYAELDEGKTNGKYPNVVVDLQYSLTEADYKVISDSEEDTSIKTRLAVSQEEQATPYIPSILNNEYPGPDSKSTCLVSFEVAETLGADFEGLNEHLVHEITDEEYATINETVGQVKALLPTTEPGVVLPPILKDVNENYPEGTIVLTSYNYSTSASASPKETLIEESFADDLGVFTASSIVGEKEWYSSSYNGVTYSKMSGYDSDLGEATDNEDWLLSSAIDLSSYATANLMFSQALNFAENHTDFVSVHVSSDYSSDIAAATWTQLTVPSTPEGTSYDFVESGSISLDEYVGKTITIGFKYTSSKADGVSPTWELTNILVEASEESDGTEVGEVEERSSYFRFDGSEWNIMDDVYILTDADYAPMGAPAKNNYFTVSDSPSQYLPAFIKSTFVYDTEGSTRFISYTYNDGSKVENHVGEYKLVDGEWIDSETSSETISKQYVRGDDSWLFDPTISFSMTTSDFSLIIDYVKVNKESTYSSYDDSEYYYGASSHYTNFDLRLSKRTEVPAFKDLEVAEGEQLAIDRMFEALGVMLSAKFPEATAQVSGVDVFYNVYFTVYDGTSSDYSATFQCVKSAPSPEFTLISAINLKTDTQVYPVENE